MRSRGWSNDGSHVGTGGKAISGVADLAPPKPKNPANPATTDRRIITTPYSSKVAMRDVSFPPHCCHWERVRRSYDEARFDERMRKLVKHKPVEKPE